MEFFKHKTSIDFMKQRKKAAVFSGLIFIISVIGIIAMGLNVGLDFRGGTQIELNYSHAVQPNQVREALTQQGISGMQVQTYGAANAILVKLPPGAQSASETTKMIHTILPDANIVQMEAIGPQVGKAMVNRGILAILVCLIATMVYIAMRFEYRFALSAAVALIHDPVLILGVFAWCQIEFNLITLAALLTILGYSLNDTIVVYDRVRENFRKIRQCEVVDLMNLSINQTLSRTIMTSCLTLVVVLALLFFGGEVLFGFSLALAIGILIGTYSSIFVAGALAIAMGLTREHLIPADPKWVDDLP